MMENNDQFHSMLLVSMMIHLVCVGIMIVLYVFRPQIELVSSSNQAQVVELYDITELPNLPAQELKQHIQEPKQEHLLAFQNISAIIQQPTSTPTPKATPRPKVRPTPSPTPKPIPTPKPWPTSTPFFKRPPLLQQEPTIALVIPRRKAVIQPGFTQQEPPDWRPTEQQQPMATPTLDGERFESGNRPSGDFSSWGLSNRPSVTLDQTDAFPYPEYLAYIEEKIEGLWFPQGSGTVSISLIIDSNGKILKSEVDKGDGFGVKKLQDSVIRTIALIKRFNPLPQEYKGMVLRVRIVVRR